MTPTAIKIIRLISPNSRTKLKIKAVHEIASLVALPFCDKKFRETSFDRSLRTVNTLATEIRKHGRLKMISKIFIAAEARMDVEIALMEGL